MFYVKCLRCSSLKVNKCFIFDLNMTDCLDKITVIITKYIIYYNLFYYMNINLLSIN